MLGNETRYGVAYESGVVGVCAFLARVRMVGDSRTTTATSIVTRGALR